MEEEHCIKQWAPGEWYSPASPSQEHPAEQQGTSGPDPDVLPTPSLDPFSAEGSDQGTPPSVPPQDETNEEAWSIPNGIQGGWYRPPSSPDGEPAAQPGISEQTSNAPSPPPPDEPPGETPGRGSQPAAAPQHIVEARAQSPMGWLRIIDEQLGVSMPGEPSPVVSQQEAAERAPSLEQGNAATGRTSAPGDLAPYEASGALNVPPASSKRGRGKASPSSQPAGAADPSAPSLAEILLSTNVSSAASTSSKATGQKSARADPTVSEADGHSGAVPKPPRRVARKTPPSTQPPDKTDPYALPLSGLVFNATDGGAGAGNLPPGTVVQRFSGSALPPRPRSSSTSRRQRRWGRAMGCLGLLTALAVCAAGVLLFKSAPQSARFGFLPGLQDATQTATIAVKPPPPATSTSTPPVNSTAGTQPTPTPNPGRPTVAFLVSSQQLTSPGGMTACQSGCDIPGQSYGNAQSFAASNVQSTFFPQTQVSGTVVATNKSSTQSWFATQFVFSGNGYHCQPQDVSVAPGSSQSFPCTVAITSPSSLPANTISGSAANQTVTYTNPQPLDGNAHWQVTAQDCNNAWNSLQSQGRAWGTTWVKSQLPGGWQLAANPPNFAYRNGQCPQGQQIQSFNASLTTQVSDNAFNPADAQTLAQSRLNGLVPQGYTLKAGSVSTCSPNVTGLSGGTVNLTCSDTGLAILTWTTSMKAQLAANVAGKTHDNALAVCNTTGGVQAGSCVITIPGSRQILPLNPAAIVVQANSP